MIHIYIAYIYILYIHTHILCGLPHSGFSQLAQVFNSR